MNSAFLVHSFKFQNIFLISHIKFYLKALYHIQIYGTQKRKFSAVINCEIKVLKFKM